MNRKTSSKATSRQLEIQTFAEKLLKKHGIDSSQDFYLKLTLPPYPDLILEKNDGFVLLGHYPKETGGFSDPMLIFDYASGEWFPVGLEKGSVDTVCSFVQDGKRKLYRKELKQFQAFQREFFQTLKAQGWLEQGIRLQEAFAGQVLLIDKGAPNPFVLGNCLSDYANPNDEP